MRREVLVAATWGLLITLILAGLIVLGSRNLAHFDAALIAYTTAVLFATFGLTYRYAMWLQRPPTASYTWLKGYAYNFIAILHAITVIGTVLWLRFGKFFHIFQRPAQIGVRFYDMGHVEEPARCRRCGAPFTSKTHVEDLIHTEQKLGYQYEMPGTVVEQFRTPHSVLRIFTPVEKT